MMSDVMVTTNEKPCGADADKDEVADEVAVDDDGLLELLRLVAVVVVVFVGG